MTYFVVESFGHGLDARKHILNLPPGALYRAKNCNLNRGGEPESAKAFVPRIFLPAGQTFGLLSAGGKLWTFGSVANPGVPSGVQYQQLVHPSGGAMTGVVHATPVKGRPFVIASFTTGIGVFMDGVLIDDFLPSGGSSYADIAVKFAAQINQSAEYTAVAAGNVVTITGRPGAGFLVTASATNGGANNDQTATVNYVQYSTLGTSGDFAHGVITFSGVGPGTVTVATSIKINGVEILSGPVIASSDVGAAAAIVANMNAFHSTPDYGAGYTGGVVDIGPPTRGTWVNGYPIVVTPNTYCANSVMAGGVDASPPLPEIVTVTFGGTFEPQDTYSITVGGTVFTTSTGVGVAGQLPTMGLAKNSKTYVIAGPNLFGSKIGDSTVWNGTGAEGCFVTDMSSELAGAEILTGMGLYQNNLAVFSRTTIQMRFVDPDPANNEQIQVMQNIGTMAGKSIVPFGDTDLFFLSDSGIRSLKTRAATNSATLSDIGSPIDNLVVAAIKAVGLDAIKKAVATMEPVDGRFMQQIGTTTYVFNYYPDAKVGGWTMYETGIAFTDFAVIEQRLYARAGDTLYLLGGINNDEYSPQAMDIKLPFLSARQLSTLKHFTGLDVVCDGVFEVSISTDPLVPDAEEIIGTVNGTTLAQGINPFQGEDVTALALRFVGRPNKYARLSSIAVHHQSLKENA